MTTHNVSTQSTNRVPDGLKNGPAWDSANLETYLAQAHQVLSIICNCADGVESQNAFAFHHNFTNISELPGVALEKVNAALVQVRNMEGGQVIK